MPKLDARRQTQEHLEEQEYGDNLSSLLELNAGGLPR